MTAPLMKLAASEQRKTAACSMSRDATEAAERDVAPQVLFDSARDEALHAFGVFDRAGRDGVDADAVAAPLDREVARQRVHAGLRRRDVELHRRAEVVQRRADVENLAAVLF